jgi:ABC-type transporter MlaC component
MRRFPIILAFWFMLVALAITATPLDYTRSILEHARTIVAGDQTLNEKPAALAVLFDKFLDADAMGRATLGQNWSRFTPAQQAEFLGLFRHPLVQKLLLFKNHDFVYAGQQFSDSITQPRPMPSLCNSRYQNRHAARSVWFHVQPEAGGGHMAAYRDYRLAGC